MGMIIVIVVVLIVVIAIVVGVIIMKKKGINPFSKCKCKRGAGTSTVGNTDDKKMGAKGSKVIM